MRVLGISPLDKDSTVTLMEDGKIVFAAGEERFTRVKLQDGFPWQALQAAFDATGADASSIDCVRTSAAERVCDCGEGVQ